MVFLVFSSHLEELHKLRHRLDFSGRCSASLCYTVEINGKIVLVLLALGGLGAKLGAERSLAAEVGATTLVLHAEVRTALTALHAELRALGSLSTKLGAERSLATEVGAATLVLHTVMRTTLTLLAKLRTAGAERSLTLELRSGLRHLGSGGMLGSCLGHLRSNNGLLGGNLRLLRSCLLSHEGHGYEQSK